MPAPNHDPGLGNRKVMIYVAPAVHRAIKQVALDEGRSASDVYEEAARVFLEARGARIGTDPGPGAIPRAPTAAALVEAIDRQGRRIEELHAMIAGVRGPAPRSGQDPAGTKVAEAMRVVLRILRTAGVAGIKGWDLSQAAQAAGVSSGAAETARTVLRGAGLVRCEMKRWYAAGA